MLDTYLECHDINLCNFRQQTTPRGLVLAMTDIDMAVHQIKMETNFSTAASKALGSLSEEIGY